MMGSAALALAVLVNVAVAGLMWRQYSRDRDQSRAEKTRAGLLVGEACAYCGRVGQPVELDWRTMERRYVCQDARACVATGRGAPS